ncbi:c-type cytochrome [Hyphomonas sp.]|uniref:c-type cytochrome n=1 Tax=Hyphomonas sp. TaxID=87 RepID=UPI00391C6C30
MGELGLNKIFGALLATALGLMALMQLPGLVFGGAGGGHGEAHGEEMTLSQTMCSQFHHCVDIAEAASAGAVAEAVFDLGAALASADTARGERIFAGQCSTCHTITPGGANGTGPNLNNIVMANKAHMEGFNYSGPMANAEGQWSYENLDAWLKSPAGYMKGTSMSFAGLKKDADRANVIAYLAANTVNAAPFPAPLAAAEAVEGETVPAEGEVVPAEGEAVPAEGEAAPAEGETAPAEAPAEEVVPT